MRKRLAILISGRGSNMEALLQAARDPAFPAEPALVISNRPDAPGLDKARTYGVEALAIDHKPFGKNREAFERQVQTALVEARIDLVALAGFMRVLTPWFISRWEERMLNIHPSLLPKYPGVDTHRRCLEAGDARHGCTVHFVTAGVDEGPIIGQAEIDVRPGDTEASLAARLLKAEHLLYPRCLGAVARGWTRGPLQTAEIDAEGDDIRLRWPAD